MPLIIVPPVRQNLFLYRIEERQGPLGGKRDSAEQKRLQRLGNLPAVKPAGYLQGVEDKIPGVPAIKDRQDLGQLLDLKIVYGSSLFFGVEYVFEFLPYRFCISRAPLLIEARKLRFCPRLPHFAVVPFPAK